MKEGFLINLLEKSRQRTPSNDMNNQGNEAAQKENIQKINLKRERLKSIERKKKEKRKNSTRTNYLTPSEREI